MPRLIWGTLATAAITTALAGCGTSSNASNASTGGGTTPTPTNTSATSTPGPGAGSPGARTGSGGGNGTSGAGSPGGGTAPGRPHCTSGMLDASLTDLGAAAGNRYATLVLTNKSGKHCTTGGWSGLQLAGAGGTVPTEVVREGTARTITIYNGGHAYERLHWAAVPAGDETGDHCEPIATALKVIPPNNTEQITAKWGYDSVCQHGQIRLTPVTANPQPR